MAAIKTHRLAREAAMLTAIIALFAMFGPFGTFAQPLGNRLLTWSVFIVGGYAFFRPVVAGSEALTRLSGLPRWLTLCCACLIASFPVTVLVVFWLAGARWQEVRLASLIGLFPLVVLVGATVIAVQILTRRVSEGDRPLPTGRPPVASPLDSLIEPQAAAAPDDSVPADPEPANPLLARLPPALGQDVLCLHNEDHYVRVYTPLGSALVLFRLSDAVAALAHVEGAQVHRSWWVARHAVSRVEQQGRGRALELRNGERVPVARAMIGELRAAGWFR